MEIKSCLRGVVDQLKDMRNIEEMKQLIVTHLKHSSIADKDKTTMIEIIQRTTRYQDVLKKAYDFLLKYEGFGVISFSKKR